MARTLKTPDLSYREASWTHFGNQQHSQSFWLLRTSTISSLCKAKRNIIRAKALETRVVVEQMAPASISLRGPVILTAIVRIRRQTDKNIMKLFSRVDGRNILLQLVSCELDPTTGIGKRSKKCQLENWYSMSNIEKDSMQYAYYAAHFSVDHQFGTPGALFVENKNQDEIFVETIVLEGPITFACYSWVHRLQGRRIFFCNKAYLPSDTPEGLKDLRDIELKLLRGNGKGERKAWERVYDYNVYNDLGNPDKGQSFARPVLGGSERYPYPRRCRTGRIRTKSDPSVESRLHITQKNYVPRDEDFEQIKSEYFTSGRLRAIIHRLVPSIVTHFTTTPDEFDSFTDIDRLYYEGIKLQASPLQSSTSWLHIITDGLKQMTSSFTGVANALQYPLPQTVEKDKFAWMRDVEFGRQMLAGMNPMKIERLKVFPPTSSLDDKVYGPLETTLKAVTIEKYLEGFSIDEAIENEKLFILDYHDVFMPFVNKINALEGRKTYATRTIFFLDSYKELKPVAIELSLPSSDSLPNGSKKVFHPSSHGTGFWKWQLAKVHVSSNHSGFHQVVSHWLQTHASIEPYVLATNRHLSAIHPIYKLLDPHLRYTLEINSTARQTLISANGVIEKCFTAGKYALELSSAAYSSLWRFDEQSLPADLIRRGMAVKDPNVENGVRLVIEDYPYAADGLLLWSAIDNWVRSYVALHYKGDDDVKGDCEINSWWEEIKTKGHPEKKEGWPGLTSREDLVTILTSIMWVASGHHAAVNFGQFMYAGYVLNMPCMSRRLIDDDDDELISNPQKFMLSTLPNQVQATTVMAVLEILSTHSGDEEYIGARRRGWIEDTIVRECEERFEEEIKEIERVIEKRNEDPNLKNRNGAGVIPYELLLPFSSPGITARGVPNSVSI